MMLTIDRTVAAAERRWFLSVMNSFGANFGQRRVLRQDLEGGTENELDNVLIRITDPADRSRLLNFLQVAMNTDGVSTPAEKEFYQRVKKRIEVPALNLSADYLALGSLVLEHEKKTRTWKALGDIATLANQRRYENSKWFHSHYTHHAATDSLIDAVALISDLSSSRKSPARFFWGFIFLLVILAFFLKAYGNF